MAQYFRWNGAIIGKDCCLYLVVIGDQCVVDCSSIVCHLNTRGNFELATITTENDCMLRTRSRIQQTGEVIETSSVWQGGPASFWSQHGEVSSSLPYGVEETEEEKKSATLVTYLSGFWNSEIRRG
jgi:hypothetical protein